MKRFHRSLAAATVSLAALTLGAAAAHAGGFAVREQSARAQGMSFAGAASGSGQLSSMFWNPATITMNPGWQSQYSASAIVPNAEIQPLPGTSPLLGLIPSGDIGQDAIVVSGYSSIQVNDWLWIGNSTSAPYGLVTKPNDVWAGQVYSRSSKIMTFDINPIVGFKVNEWLSFAFGPEIQYFDVKLKRALSPAATAGSAILEGDNVGIGWTAGVTITPWAGTVLGVGFRSSIHHEIDGSVKPGGGFYIPVEAKLNLPETVTVGLTQSIWPNLRVNLGFEWANWSRLNTQAVVATETIPGLALRGAPVTSLALNYKDGHFYSVGAEYDWNERLTVRAGVAYEDSPITDAIRSTRLPDNDRIWASLGASYKWNEKLSFDVSYTHIFVRDTPIRIVPGHQDFIPTPAALGGLPFIADVDARVDIFSVGLKYRWDTPSVPIPAAPIVRKG
ncbi:MAG TPA: outer membrane protein transport protein [Beijerinckiaceae bacterium]|jgi:long-chain fatty acid transport protein